MSIQNLRIKQHFHPWLKLDDQSLRQSGKRWRQGLLPKNMLRNQEDSLMRFQEDLLNLQEMDGLKDPVKQETGQQYGN